MSNIIEHIDRYLTINSTLNKDLFDKDDKLCPDIKEQLIYISQEFIKFLKIPVEPEDIIITGSNAAFNYTDLSDIDIHIIVDFSTIDGNSTLIKEFFLSKKSIWNDRRDIQVKGYPIEIYVQSKTEELVSSGVYSLISDSWINKPIYAEVDPKFIDEPTINKKVEQFHYDINSAIQDKDIERLTRIKDKIKKLRKSGLHSKGELSVENLTFKSLRNDGTIGNLMDGINELYNKQLSLEQVQNEGKIGDLLKPMSKDEQTEMSKKEEDTVEKIYRDAMDNAHDWEYGTEKLPHRDIRATNIADQIFDVYGMIDMDNENGTLYKILWKKVLDGLK
jgi:predicted nucleotidyltransferase